MRQHGNDLSRPHYLVVAANCVMINVGENVGLMMRGCHILYGKPAAVAKDADCQT